jgi:hypothetical protein
MQSSNVAEDLHTTFDHYYAEAIAGDATARLGEEGELRLVSALIGSVVDQCDGCISDATDAVAVNAAACAVVYRMHALHRGMRVPLCGQDGAEEAVAKLAAVTFERRRVMVTVAVSEMFGLGSDGQGGTF